MSMQSIKVEVFEVTKNDATFSFHQNAPGTIEFDRTGSLFLVRMMAIFSIFFPNMIMRSIKIVVLEATP